VRALNSTLTPPTYRIYLLAFRAQDEGKIKMPLYMVSFFLLSICLMVNLTTYLVNLSTQPQSGYFGKGILDKYNRIPCYINQIMAGSKIKNPGILS
jgi:hypothetical protein